MNYITMLPFLSREDLKELAFKVINKEVKGVKLVVLFPFLDKDTLDKIANILIKNNNGKQLRYALPFCSKETFGKIYKAIENGELTGIEREMVLPFLTKDQVKEMFEELLKKAENEPIDKDEDDYEDEDEE